VRRCYNCKMARASCFGGLSAGIMNQRSSASLPMRTMPVWLARLASFRGSSSKIVDQVMAVHHVLAQEIPEPEEHAHFLIRLQHIDILASAFVRRWRLPVARQDAAYFKVDMNRVVPAALAFERPDFGGSAFGFGDRIVHVENLAVDGPDSFSLPNSKNLLRTTSVRLIGGSKRSMAGTRLRSGVGGSASISKRRICVPALVSRPSGPRPSIFTRRLARYKVVPMG